ncbi:MAG: DUF4360 domain-containing protein [Cyanobacteria bacterium J06635_10]
MNSKNFRKVSINLIKIFVATATVMAASVAPALANRVRILDAKYGGSGCPGGSASVAVSPDGQELSILFDEFIADASARRAKDRRKSCNLAIPIQVPPGFQVSVYDFDYRGYVAPSTRGRLRAEYFFAGRRGPRFTRIIRGEQDYSVRDRIKTLVWSACGDKVNMRVNAALSASGKGIATLDSVDVSHALKYRLRYRSC